jgi:hypothetical protein
MDYLDTARDYMKSNKYEENVDEVFNGKETGTTHRGGQVTKTAHGIKHTKTDYEDGNGERGAKRKDDVASRYTKYPILDKDDDVDEAKYQGREVPLGKKMAGDVKKSKVYVKNPQGRVVKVNFGDKKMRIKKSNPARRKSFRARHNCANPGPRHKARYWSCRSW